MQKIIFDAHQDILIHEQDKYKKVTQTGFLEIVKSPIKLVVASVFLLPEKIKGLSNNKQAQLAEKQIRDYLKIINNNKDFLLIKDKNDLQKMMKEGTTGILIHIEGVDFINEKNAYLIDDFYELGLRSIGLVWGKDNYIGGYSGGKIGLTSFGKKFIKKLNKKNIIIDGAHSNENTFYDVIKLSQKPIMISHGNCYELCKDERNFKEAQLRLLAKKEGVQGIFFSKKYVSQKNNISIKDIIEQFSESYKISPEITMIGSDFGGISSGFVDGLENINKLDGIIKLIQGELGKEAVKKISYKNFLKFLEKNL